MSTSADTRSGSRQAPHRSGRPGAEAGVDAGADAGADAALTVATVLAGPLLVLSGLHLLDLGPWADSGTAPAHPDDLAGHLFSGGARGAEVLIGLLAATAGTLLSLGAAVAAAAAVVVVLLRRIGRTAPSLLQGLAPRYMRRGVALALGAQAAVGGIAAPTALAAPGPVDQGTSVVAQSVDERPETTDAPDRDAPPTDAPAADHQEDPVAPLFIPQAPEPAEDRHQQAETRPSAEVEEAVTVRPGDTLWDIAAAELGPGASDWEIAAEWPRWHEANLASIGEDPALLHPGTLLERPTPLYD